MAGSVDAAVREGMPMFSNLYRLQAIFAIKFSQSASYGTES
jgi:hypothetical protein